jgi:hypothetical protein
LKNDVQTPIFFKKQPATSQISQTAFEIAYLLAWNFRNKFRNSFKPNDRHFFSKNAYFFGKRDIIFFQNFFLVNFSTETKSAPKLNKIGAGRFLPCLLI